MENKICVYAICKNESKFVDTWVESMKEADSIVVLDTGSTDDTVEKLKKYPFVRVEQKIISPWRFDEGRNESLKLVPDDCNILVCTDLDEVLEPGWAEPLRQSWIDGVHERCTYKYAWSHTDSGEPGRIFAYNKIHSRNWMWKHPVHELLYNIKTNTDNYDINESLNLWDKIYLHHYPDHTKSRSSYLPLLKLRAKEDPNDYYGLIYLAHEYTYQYMYEESINTLKYILKTFSDKIDSTEKASCYLFMGDAYNKLNDKNSAIKSYIDALYTDETYREPYINLAKVYMELKDWSMAISYLKEGIKKSYRHYSWLERDTSWTYEPWDMLAISSFYNGDKNESLAYAAKALSYDKNNDHLIFNFDIILKMSTDIDLLK